MTMTYAAITGRITYHGSDVGTRLKVSAVPQTEGGLLKFPGDRVTWGVMPVETDDAGNLPTGTAALRIPLGSSTPGVLWKIVLEPVYRDSGLPLRWTAGPFNITADIRFDVLIGDPVAAIVPPTVTAADLADSAMASNFNNTASATFAAAAGSFAQVVGLPASNGTNDTSAIQAKLTAAAAMGGAVVRGLPGAAYKISAPLVISSNTTLDMTGCSVTQIAGSNSRMLQNAAYKGTGARDANIAVIGGTWDRGANDGTTGADTHSLVFHRVDGLRVLDGTHTSTGGKYAILVGDVTSFTIERHVFNVAADGVHIQGPASNGVVRNISGTTGDDCVAITARDYPAYDLTTAGGSVSNVTIEDVFSVNGLKQAVKVFAGLGNAVSGITIQRIRGNVGGHGVSVFHDTAVPELLGGTIDGVTIRDVDLTTLSAYGSVQVSAPGVSNLAIDSIVPRGGKALTFTSTAVAGTVRVSNVGTSPEYALNLIDVQTGAAVTDLLVRGVMLDGKTDKSAGRLVNAGGTIATLSLSSIRQKNAEAVVYVGGSCAKVNLTDVDSTSNYGVRHTAANPCAVSVVNGNFTTTLGILRVSGGTGATGSISGSGITSTVAAIARTGTQPLRVNGAQFRADLAVLAPTAGDQSYNTNGSVSAGTGLCVTDGTTWKNLMSGATYNTPFSGTAFLDQFTGVGALNTHLPNTGKAWVDTGGGFAIDASGLVGNVISTTALVGYYATGDATMTGTLQLTSEATSLLGRILLKYVDSNNYIRIEVSGSGVNPTVKVDKVIAGTTTNLATLAGSLGLNADGTTYTSFPFTFSVVGTAVTLTMNGNTATGTLVAGDVTALASAQKIGLLSTRHLRLNPGLKVDVVGNYAA